MELYQKDLDTKLLLVRGVQKVYYNEFIEMKLKSTLNIELYFDSCISCKNECFIADKEEVQFTKRRVLAELHKISKL